MKKNAKKYAKDNMLPKMTMEDVLWVVMEEGKVLKNHITKEDLSIEENIAIIDNRFLELESFVGRSLTEYEQSEILDIVDQYTPKDKDDNYLCSLLPFDYAWEIYQIINSDKK